MNVLYDSSALIALFVEDHPLNGKANYVHNNLKDQYECTFFMCAHSIAELYNNFTRGKGFLSFPPTDATKLINEIVDIYFNVIDLNKHDYLNALKYLKTKKLTGPIVYDTIIAQSSNKVSAKCIVTLDKDYSQLSGLTDASIINPAKN